MGFSAEDRLATAPLRVRLLGGFAVEGVDERALGTRKARVLLKQLAVAQGRPVPVDELVEVVWGDETPRTPSDQLSVLVSRLRSVLGAHRLPRTDAGYSLAADWIDTVELEERTREVEERLRSHELGSALAAAQVALATARGPLLPEEDAAWADEARPSVDRLVARARLLAAEARLAVGEFAAARVAAQSVLDLDAYDEAALRLVMRADASAGRPGAALAAFTEVRHRLAEDLGTSPAPETELLHTAILRGEIRTGTPSRPIGGPLIGRDVELRLLDSRLSQIEAATAPPRRTAIHRAAVVSLAARPQAEPLALARHAHLGRDPAVAARALAAAAERGEARLREVVTGGGFTRFRRAAETPFNLVLEARP